jgi:hypothetical protein
VKATIDATKLFPQTPEAVAAWLVTVSQVAVTLVALQARIDAEHQKTGKFALPTKYYRNEDIVDRSVL